MLNNNISYKMSSSDSYLSIRVIHRKLFLGIVSLVIFRKFMKIVEIFRGN